MPQTKRKRKIKISKNLEALIIAASLKLVVEKEWHQISLGDIADFAELSLVEVRQIFPSKIAILKALHKINSLDKTIVSSAILVIIPLKIAKIIIDNVVHGIPVS